VRALRKLASLMRRGQTERPAALRAERA
jgi:hypothetical protein